MICLDINVAIYVINRRVRRNSPRAAALSGQGRCSARGCRGCWTS
jgi:hypothetical protein